MTPPAVAAPSTPFAWLTGADDRAARRRAARVRRAAQTVRTLPQGAACGGWPRRDAPLRKPS